MSGEYNVQSARRTEKQHHIHEGQCCLIVGQYNVKQLDETVAE